MLTNSARKLPQRNYFLMRREQGGRGQKTRGQRNSSTQQNLSERQALFEEHLSPKEQVFEPSLGGLPKQPAL